MVIFAFGRYVAVKDVGIFGNIRVIFTEGKDVVDNNRFHSVVVDIALRIQHFESSLSIATTHQTNTISGEELGITGIDATVFSGDYFGCGDSRGDTFYSFVAALIMTVRKLANKQGHVIGVQIEVGKNIIVKNFNYLLPLRIVNIREISLILEENAFNDALLLCFFSKSNQSGVGVFAVFIVLITHFSRIGIFRQLLNSVVESCHGHDTNSFIGEILRHHAAEIVDEAKAGALLYQRGHSVVPVAGFANGRGEIATGHHLEVGGNVDAVNLLDCGLIFAVHVTLSYAQVNVEVGVCVGVCCRCCPKS